MRPPPGPCWGLATLLREYCTPHSLWGSVLRQLGLLASTCSSVRVSSSVRYHARGKIGLGKGCLGP